MKNKKKNGFTLMEMIIVLALLTIIAAVAIPSVSGYVASGKQTSRDSIARTLYLAAQSTLTEKKTFGELADFCVPLLSNNSLDDHISTAEATTRFLHSNGPDRAMLLAILEESVLDKTLLDHAITIEFDIITGAVISAFYNEALTNFSYDKSGKNHDISGDRPYSHASARKQGYFGAVNVESVPSTTVPSMVNLYDGTQKELSDSFSPPYKNILYAEIFLPKDVTSAIFEIVDSAGVKYSLPLTLPTIDSSLYHTLTLPLTVNSSSHLIYKKALQPGELSQFGVDLTKDYAKYIWVLDYVYGDTVTKGFPYSIAPKYGITSPHSIGVQVRKTSSDDGKISALQNPLFGGAVSGAAGTFAIRSPRHLNNIRYAPSADFAQVADLDMMDLDLQDLNFTPIPTFSGTYNGYKTASGEHLGQYVIRNLAIEVTHEKSTLSHVGLFGAVDGSLRGIALEKGSITACGCENSPVHVGALVGELQGTGRIFGCNSFSNVRVVDGTVVHAGGLVGSITDGTLEQSYNGGFLTPKNGTEIDIGMDFGTVIVHGTKGYSTVYVGGLVGRNKGTVQTSYNNARVNIKVVRLTSGADPNADLSQLVDGGAKLSPSYSILSTTAATAMGGIVGRNDGMVSKVYATNHVAAYVPKTSGGIVGMGKPEVGSSFISNNGMMGILPLSKDDLAATNFGAEWRVGTGYKKGAIAYPYPTLLNNPHRTPLAPHRTAWEDILEEPLYNKALEDMLKYYEIYDAGNGNLVTGLYSLDPVTGAPISTLRDDLAVVEDGYCIFGGNLPKKGTFTYTIKGLSDNANKPVKADYEDGKWTPRAAAVGKVVAKTLPNTALTPGKPNETKEIHVLSIHNQGALVAMGSDKTQPTVLEFSCNKPQQEFEIVYQPLYAKGIQKDKTAATEFIIRSPRHLVNISETAGAHTYRQESPIEFATYQDYDGVDQIVPLYRNFPSAVVPIFTGKYYGNHKAIGNLHIGQSNFGSTTPALHSYVGLFGKVNSKALLDGIAVVNSRVSGQNYVGCIAGEINSATINSCHVNGGLVEGAGAYGGGIVGRIDNSAANSLSVANTLISLRMNPFGGGIAGQVANSTMTNVLYSYAQQGPSLTGISNNLQSGVFAQASSGGGIAGNLVNSKLSNAYVTNFVGELTGPFLLPPMFSVVANSTHTDIYFLQGVGFNDRPFHAPFTSADGITYPAQGLPLSSIALQNLQNAAPFNAAPWIPARGSGYPYPMLQGQPAPVYWYQPAPKP